jgi:hypothetical protein
LNFNLKPNTSVKFHYKVLIASGQPVTDEVMNKEANKFAKE